MTIDVILTLTITITVVCLVKVSKASSKLCAYYGNVF